MVEPLLFVGLGNPGSVYQKTRHNVGFLSMEAAAAAESIKLSRVLFRPYETGKKLVEGRLYLFIKPLTYMNRSGIILPRLLKKYRFSPQTMIVLCDNMDLSPGSVRIKKGGGTAGHRGLASIQREIQSADFIRIYIGIGRPGPGIPTVDHVLGIPGEQEASQIRHGIDHAAEALRGLMRQPLERVMNEYNRKDAHRSGT